VVPFAVAKREVSLMDVFHPQLAAGYIAGNVKRFAMEEEFHLLLRQRFDGLAEFSSSARDTG
jgi:hypothetical protein